MKNVISEVFCKKTVLPVLRLLQKLTQNLILTWRSQWCSRIRDKMLFSADISSSPPSQRRLLRTSCGGNKYETNVLQSSFLWKWFFSSWKPSWRPQHLATKRNFSSPHCSGSKRDNFIRHKRYGKKKVSSFQCKNPHLFIIFHFFTTILQSEGGLTNMIFFISTRDI